MAIVPWAAAGTGIGPSRKPGPAKYDHDDRLFAFTPVMAAVASNLDVAGSNPVPLTVAGESIRPTFPTVTSTRRTAIVPGATVPTFQVWVVGLYDPWVALRAFTKMSPDPSVSVTTTSRARPGPPLPTATAITTVDPTAADAADTDFIRFSLASTGVTGVVVVLLSARSSD